MLHGRDDRLVVVVGPCSIHDHDQALEYARRLKAAADALHDDLLIVMRVYFEKPRTTVGWKGYINDPHLDGSFAHQRRPASARASCCSRSTRIGLPTGTEFLDLLSPQYIADLIAWGAIGARTTESQSHRQLASGLSCPVGFKNGTDGGVQGRGRRDRSRPRAPHAFMGMTKMGMAAIFETRGNDDCHVILRGGKAPELRRGRRRGRLRARSRRRPARAGDGRLLARATRGKQHQRQIDVAHDVARADRRRRARASSA